MASRRRRANPWWAKLPSSELLDVRLCDLELKIEGTAIEARAERLLEESIRYACSPWEDQLLDALREHLAPLIAKHKIPRYIWIVSEPLPRNASGKLLKPRLRERFSKPAPF